MKLKHTLLTGVFISLLLSCGNGKYSSYIEKNNPDIKKINQLFSLLEKYNEYTENRFTVMSEIVTYISKQNDIGKLNLLITDYINRNPDDPYNSFYLLSLASAYMNRGNSDFAIPYLHRSVMEYNDLVIRGESTHCKALEILLEISPDNDFKVVYYKKLIREYKDFINKRDRYLGGVGELYYYLGKTLESMERWEEAMDAYENYLDSENAEIAKEPDARSEITKKVGFYHSDKKWVVSDLDKLVNNIKYALSIKNAVLLDRYRAFDFFIINWNSNYTDLISSFPMESSVLASMSLKTYKNLDPMSTDNEAYLAVYGNQWSSTIWYVYPIWYFYFKKVDYPMDPQIHGGWEWAGIYLGEKV